MKLLIFLTIASAAVMIVMVLQVAHQEMNRHTLQVRVRDRATEIQNRDKRVSEMRGVVQGVKAKLLSMTKLTEEMKTKKAAALKEKTTLEEQVKKCNTEKEDVKKTITDSTANLNKQRSDHDQAKQTAQKTIQELKESNLDHEKAMCALIDETVADARKLCGLAPR